MQQKGPQTPSATLVMYRNFTTGVGAESHVSSIEAVRYQGPNIRETLLEVRDKTTDALTKVEAQALAEEVGSYCFQICTVVWHDILSQVNHVSKLLQSATMQLDVVPLMKAKASLTTYRDTGFAAAQAIAKDICEEMNVEAVLKEKRLRSTRKHFACEAPDEPIGDAMKRLETAFFNVVVVIESLKERFETLGEVIARFVLNFKNLDGGALSNQRDELWITLSTRDEHDIDGLHWSFSP